VTSKFVESAIMKSTFFKNQYGYQETQNVDADYESVEKLAKIVQNLSPCNSFFWVTVFDLFSTDSNSASSFAFYDTQIEF
jgi:hypothetical protein